MLVPLAAAAGAGIVATCGGRPGGTGGCFRERGGGLCMSGLDIENAAENCDCRLPLAERYAVAAELQQLRRARDPRRKPTRQLRDFLLRNDAAKVIQTMKAERLANRVRGLERECVGECF